MPCLSFGAGPPRCLGNPVARSEPRTVLEELLTGRPHVHASQEVTS